MTKLILWYFGSEDQRLHAPTLRLVILYFRIENHKVAPTLNLVMFVLNLAGTDITVRFKVFLWSYLWNLNWYTTPKNPSSTLQCGLCNVSQFFLLLWVVSSFCLSNLVANKHVVSSLVLKLLPFKVSTLYLSDCLSLLFVLLVLVMFLFWNQRFSPILNYWKIKPGGSFKIQVTAQQFYSHHYSYIIRTGSCWHAGIYSNNTVLLRTGGSVTYRHILTTRF
jgi:hypothetical protein